MAKHREKGSFMDTYSYHSSDTNPIIYIQFISLNQNISNYSLYLKVFRGLAYHGFGDLIGFQSYRTTETISKSY